jgi:GNAT superfamily N-acetyltransferase
VDDKLELRTYQGRLPTHLNWQVVSFIRIVWSWLDKGSMVEPCDPALRPVHFALVAGDALISHASASEVEMEHAGERFRMGGLGNVMTFPAFRGRGYGNRVVEAATQHLRSSDADVAALFCGAQRVPFYQRSGWSVVPSEPGSEDTRMMLFISARGLSARPAFEAEPFHVDQGW